MSLLRNEKAAFLRAEVTKDGIIKTRQVIRNSDGSLPDVSINDASKVFSKDIILKQYKGLVYALPAPEGEKIIAVSYPSNVAKSYIVEKRESVKID